MKKSFILSFATIAIALFTIWANTDNIWNSPNFEIKVTDNSKKDGEMKPVDVLVRVIYDDRGNKNLTADWLRDRDSDTLSFLKEQFSSEDAWILDRIYHNSDIDGKSQKIIIKNIGLTQAHDVIIQITGNDNFKIIDYICPEIMSNEQIIKNLGKKYVISKSRLSINLECEIIINSVGNSGINKVIVTANDSHPRVWPDHTIEDTRTQLIIVNIILYIVIGVLAIIIAYNVLQLWERNIKNKKKLSTI